MPVADLFLKRNSYFDVTLPRLSNWQSTIGNFNYSSSAKVTFSTSRKFSSTGVDRPKMVTVTFKVDLSSFTSSTLPVKLWNGPDLIRTVSPAAYENFGFGFSAASVTL